MKISQIGQTVRAHRKKIGLSQKELADLAGVGKTVVFDIEKGKSSVRFDSLTKVLHALNISISLSSPFLEALREKKS